MNMQSFDSTAINWIGNIKYSGDEWSYFKKKFVLSKVPDFAVIRLDSQGVCGIYVNGIFTESSCGRYFHRITHLEITSLLKEGENEIIFKSGSHFLQPTGFVDRERRELWYSAVAAEIVIKSGQDTQTIVTDDSWQCTSDEGEKKAEIFSKINYGDYHRFWERAVLMKEPKPPHIHKAVVEFAGNEYVAYANQPWQLWTESKEILETKQKGEVWETIYDFGKTYVGYMNVEYESNVDTEITIWFDNLETVKDFTGESTDMPWVVDELAIKVPVKKGHHTVQLLRRRACRYVKTDAPDGVTLSKLKFRLSMMASDQIGWFTSSDKMLNEMWETGKYTLHVNKHQEYECCPRHEMKYFSGDGYIEALIDYYAFGGKDLTNASLSLTEIHWDVGLRPDVYCNNEPLWDYPAWRILMVYNLYYYFKDMEGLRQNYAELVQIIEWYRHRASGEGLIYQFPVWQRPFYNKPDCTEYTCSSDRLGEKPFLNALYYKSLLCMSELAEVMGDMEHAQEWASLAGKVRQAFNERLWNEEKGVYLDTYDPRYVPQDGNAMAMLYGIADAERTKKILENLKKTNWTPYGPVLLSKRTNHTLGGNTAISPLMLTVEIEARFQNGDIEGAMELIRRFWGTLLKKDAGTFWEYSPNDEDAVWPYRCHGWGGACTYLIGAYVLGIKPQTAGYETLHFEPYDGIESFIGVVPTVKGLVAAKCSTVSGKKQYEILIPKGVHLQSELPKDAILLVSEYEEDM